MLLCFLEIQDLLCKHVLTGFCVCMHACACVYGYQKATGETLVVLTACPLGRGCR